MKTNIKPVRKLDLSGNILQTYRSLADAEKDTNVFQSAISKCCKNKQNTAGGFRWEYVEEVKL